MDKVTQQNAAMVQQTSTASRGLASEATGLAELVGEFQIDGGKQPAVAAAPGRARRWRRSSLAGAG